MIRNIWRKAKELAMAGLLAVAGCAGNVASNVTLSEIVCENTAISRGEFMARNLPANSDVYVVDEWNGDSNFFKARAQIVPIKCGPVQIGISGQFVDGSNMQPSQELGALVRVVGKPKGVFGKADTAYFLEENKLEGYALVASKNVSADILWKYDFDNNSGFLRPGVDYKITNTVTAGIEGKFSGRFDDLQQNYLGARIKVIF